MAPEVELQLYLPERGRSCCFVRASLGTTRLQSRHLALSALSGRPWKDSIRQDSEPQNHLRVMSHIVSQECSFSRVECRGARSICNCSGYR